MAWGWLETHRDLEVQDFLEKYFESDPQSVLLKIPREKPWNRDYIFSQINGVRIFQKKFPSLRDHSWILPHKKALEQASSEISASRKASLFNGDRLVDLTAGMGSDLFFMSGSFKAGVGLESDPTLSELTAFNFQISRKSNVEILNQDSLDFLGSIEYQEFDLIFVDPDRRAKQGRAFRFSDSSPMLVGQIPLLLDKSKKVLIKSSPMLDLDYGIRELGIPFSIRILSIGWECKEVLFLFKKDIQTNDPDLILDWFHEGKWKSWRMKLSESKNRDYEYGMEGGYLFDPNPSVLKSQSFSWVCSNFGLRKISRDTHIFLGEEVHEDFPGRIMKVRKLGDFKDNAWGSDQSFEVLMRNFPIERTQILKDYKIKEGVGHYLVFFCDEKGKKKWAQCEPI